MNEPPEPRSTPAGRPLSLVHVITTAFFTQLIFCMVATTPGVFAPVAAPDMGVGAHLVGVLYAVQGISGLLLGTVSAVLFRRFGLVRTLQGGAVAIALSMLLGATGLPMLALAAGMLMGMALGPAGPASTFLLARVAPREKLNVLVSIQQSGPPIGIALGGVVFPPLILALGWHEALLVTSVAGIAVVLFLQPLRARVDTTQSGASLSLASFTQPIRLVLETPRLRQIALAAPLFGTVHAGQIVFLVVYLNIEMGRDLVVAGLALTGSQLAAVAGRIFWGWLADRRRDAFLVLALISFGALAGSLALAVYPKSGPTWPLVLIAIYYGATAAGWQGVLYASTARYAPAGQVVAATAGMQFYMFMGGIGGPLLVAAIIAIAGNYATAYWVLSALALVLGLRLLAARRVLTKARS